MDIALLIVYSIQEVMKEMVKYVGNVKNAMTIVIKGTV